MNYLSPKTFAILMFLLFVTMAPRAHAQDKTFYYGVNLQGAAATGDSDTNTLPFGLYSNQHGMVDPYGPGGYAAFNFQKRLATNRSGFDYGFGATLINRLSPNKTVFFNQLYGRLSYGAFQLSGGRFYEQTGTVDSDLTMGSLAISSNATPMFKIKIGIPEYTDVPLTHGYVEVKGALAHGWFEKDRVVHHAWLHEKYAYFRFGGDFAFKPYAGLVDEATWAGETATEGNIGDSFADFKRVFFGLAGKGNVPFGDKIFREGDHRGIWDFGFYLTLHGLDFTVYRQFLYNDKDGLKLQTPEDGLLGVSMKLPAKKQHLLTKVLWEYLYSKNQSGPECPRNDRGGAGGCDDYYNNFFYRSGWTYFGNTIGNPLFLPFDAPGITNPALPAGIVNNRIVAQHFGIEGRFSPFFNYKFLATWSRNYGLYDDIFLFQDNGPNQFDSNPEEWSLLTRFSYTPPSFQFMRLNATLAGDFGQLYKNKIGIMLGFQLLGNSSF